MKITPSALLQISETVAYISTVLAAPETALAWADLLEKEIAGLSTMPARFPTLEEEPWKSRGLRKMPVKNFIVYYYADDETKTVWVTAVIYGKRDQLNALREIPEVE